MELIRAKVVSVYEATDKKGWYIDVLQMPTLAKITKVELPRITSNQELPRVGDIVLVWRPSSDSTIYIRTLRDKEDLLANSLRREIKDGESFFQPGEIQQESDGGAYHYMSNQGDHHLVAGSMIEKIRIESTAEKVLLEGRNIDIKTIETDENADLDIEETTGYRILADDKDNLILQKHAWANPLKGPESEIAFDTDGNIELRRLNGMRPELSKKKSSILLKDDDNIEIKVFDILENEKSSIVIEPNGTITIEGDSIKLGKSASRSLVKGEPFRDLFNGHTHGSPVGPTGPPLIGMSSPHLSEKVKTD